MSEKQSKFSALLRTRKEDPTDAAGEPQAKPVKDKPATNPVDERAGDRKAKRPRGRPKANGKRLNPDYTQVTAYIPSDLHTETKINLIRTGKREFSILIEELLTSWNKKQDASQHAA